MVLLKNDFLTLIFCMKNVRNTNFFTNYLCGAWLLVNKKLMLLVAKMRTSKKLATITVCKNVVI